MFYKEYKLKSKNGDIVLRHYFPDDTQNYPTIFMLTGDSPKGFSGYSCQRLLPEFIDKKIGVVVFDFHGLGISDGSRKNLTLTLARNDFRQACNKFFKLPLIDFNKTTLFATSFGATVTLSYPTLANKFDSIILRSPCVFLPEAYINEIGVSQYDLWEKNGFCDINGYSFQVLLDPLKYNVYKSSTKIVKDCLIIYGDKDEVVPLIQTKILSSILKCTKKIVCIENANHGYSLNESFEAMKSTLFEYLRNRYD